jgi:Ca2+-dependent lipid-binding protein
MTIACSALIDMDTFSRSDPFAILYIKAEKDKIWRKLG